MKKQIKYGGKIFRYMISLGMNRIYRTGRQQIIVDEKGKIDPYRNVFHAKEESR